MNFNNTFILPPQITFGFLTSTGGGHFFSPPKDSRCYRQKGVSPGILHNRVFKQIGKNIS